MSLRESSTNAYQHPAGAIHTLPVAVQVPSQWKTSKTVLLYKKGDVHDIGNYRPICLLFVVYKLFTRVILNRISRTLDGRQPYKQTRFRREFSMIDHTAAVPRVHRPKEGSSKLKRS
ncbi:unnamed protein product [Heligmosomoides polygyrus]|uniref:Reverse transcriptase domain-containing protein n=1 Tax=Heligmosomoides polygyrus TaxID=6339 RepID=A0A183FQM4_HELPZ|nr:unnamed protein product [Heligmosomoides polygyrus]